MLLKRHTIISFAKKTTVHLMVFLTFYNDTAIGGCLTYAEIVTNVTQEDFADETIIFSPSIKKVRESFKFLQYNLLKNDTSNNYFLPTFK